MIVNTYTNSCNLLSNFYYFIGQFMKRYFINTKQEVLQYIILRLSKKLNIKNCDY